MNPINGLNNLFIFKQIIQHILVYISIGNFMLLNVVQYKNLAPSMLSMLKQPPNHHPQSSSQGSLSSLSVEVEVEGLGIAVKPVDLDVCEDS